LLLTKVVNFFTITSSQKDPDTGSGTESRSGSGSETSDFQFEDPDPINFGSGTLLKAILLTPSLTHSLIMNISASLKPKA
jgi:hypothetical protein